MTDHARVSLEPLLLEIIALKAERAALQRRLAAAERELGERRYADAYRLKLARVVRQK